MSLRTSFDRRVLPYRHTCLWPKKIAVTTASVSSNNYPSSRNHGSEKWVPPIVVTFQIQPFYTSMIVGESVQNHPLHPRNQCDSIGSKMSFCIRHFAFKKIIGLKNMDLPSTYRISHIILRTVQVESKFKTSCDHPDPRYSAILIQLNKRQEFGLT